MAAPAARAAIQASRRQLIPGIFSATRLHAATLGQYQGALDRSALPALTATAVNQPFNLAFDYGIAAFGKEKPQGEEITGDHPAENARNDVPPLSPEESAKHPEVPPSPDATNSTATDSNYSSPGQHPKNTDKDAFEPDMDNASPAVTQKASGALDMDSHMAEVSSCGSREEKAATQAQDAVGVKAAPVETLMETPLSANNQPSSDRTGPASHDDSPSGVDRDPNVVPPTDLGDDKSGSKGDKSDGKKVEEADKQAWKAMSI